MKLGGLVVLAAALALAGCAHTPPPVSEKVSQYYEQNKTLPATVEPMTFAAVGDSITEANSPDFVGQQIGDGSWVYHASRKGLRFAGGWADGGAPTPTMVANATRVDADVLVIIAGTNDVGRRPFAESAGNVELIAQKVGAPRVIVSAIPPLDPRPQAATDYNTQMKAFAESKGWEWVDAMVGVRAGDRWIPEMTIDGTHPTKAAARLIGEELSRAALGL